MVWDATMKAVDESDHTCLTIAALRGYEGLVDTICQFSSLEVLQYIWIKTVPLHCAVYNSHHAVVERFIEHLCDIDPAALDYVSAERNLPSPFWYAVREGDVPMINLLVDYADVDRECRGYTQLAVAVSAGRSDVVEHPLNLNSPHLHRKRRVNVNSVCAKTGQTPLDLAIVKAHQRCVELLTEHNTLVGQPWATGFAAVAAFGGLLYSAAAAIPSQPPSSSGS